VSDDSGVWAVLDDWAYKPVLVTRETAQTVWYRDRDCERKTLNALAWRGTKERAEALSQKLRSARNEQNRRKTEANIWFDRRVKELMETSGE